MAWTPKPMETFTVEMGDLHGFRVRSNRDRALWAFFETRREAEGYRIRLEQIARGDYKPLSAHKAGP